MVMFRPNSVTYIIRPILVNMSLSKFNFQTFGAILLSCHYLSYGLNGVGLSNGKLWGRILEASADMIFVLLLILIAKGYTGVTLLSFLFSLLRDIQV